MQNSLNQQMVLLTFQIYPKGVWFLFFKGRLEFMKGNLDEALVWYKKSWKSQDLWPQFHHLCYWEILWVNWYDRMLAMLLHRVLCFLINN